MYNIITWTNLLNALTAATLNITICLRGFKSPIVGKQHLWSTLQCVHVTKSCRANLIGCGEIFFPSWILSNRRLNSIKSQTANWLRHITSPEPLWFNGLLMRIINLVQGCQISQRLSCSNQGAQWGIDVINGLFCGETARWWEQVGTCKKLCFVQQENQDITLTRINLIMVALAKNQRQNLNAGACNQKMLYQGCHPPQSKEAGDWILIGEELRYA